MTLLFYLLATIATYLAMHEIVSRLRPHTDLMSLHWREVLVRYTAGVACVLLLARLAVPTSPVDGWTTVALGFVCAGLGTSSGYVLDWLIRVVQEHRVLLREHEELEGVLNARADPTGHG